MPDFFLEDVESTFKYNNSLKLSVKAHKAYLKWKHTRLYSDRKEFLGEWNKLNVDNF